MSQTQIAKSLDNNALLAAIISGGIISGTVSLLEGNFEKSKYIFPAAIAVGIFADYQLKRKVSSENIRIVGEFFSDLEREEKSTSVDYLRSQLSAVSNVLTVVLGAHYFTTKIGFWRIAPFPFTRWLTDQTEENIIEEPEMPRPQNVGALSSIIAPTLMQLAIGGNRPGLRRAGRTLVLQVVMQAMTRIDYTEVLASAIETGSSVIDAVREATENLTNSLADIFSTRVEGTHLTNESNVLLTDGHRNYNVLLDQNHGETIVPSVRINEEDFRELQQQFGTFGPEAREIDLTVQTPVPSFSAIPDIPLPQTNLDTQPVEEPISVSTETEKSGESTDSTWTRGSGGMSNKDWAAERGGTMNIPPR